MRIPRDVAATDLVKALARLGYRVTRQKGSHIRVTTDMDGEHHEVVPNHDPVKIGHCAAFSRVWPNTIG